MLPINDPETPMETEHLAALHEAAHFVTLIMGYCWEDEDVPRGTPPHVLSIRGQTASDYFLRDPAMFLPVLVPTLLADYEQVRYAIVLLSGMAAQYTYGPTSISQEDCAAVGRNLDAYPDLANVMKLTAAMVSAGDTDEQPQALALRLWQLTIALLQADVVRQAIEYVAGQLDEQKEIHRPALFELQEAVFALPGFSALRLAVTALGAGHGVTH